MRPRNAYRVSIIVLPLAVLFAVVSTITGAWLSAVVMLLLTASTTYNLVSLRRQGMRWNGPRTFAEWRANRRNRS